MKHSTIRKNIVHTLSKSMLMQYQRQTAVKVELSSSPSNYLQRRPVTDAVYRRRAVVFSLLWNAPPYPVMTPSARAELGLQMLNDENLPGYIEKVLEWFRKNDEYNQKSASVFEAK